MGQKYKIIRNAAQCKICGEIIESKTRHDFVGCKCFKESGGTKGIAVDGGTDYLRRCGDPNTWIELSESERVEAEE